MHRITWIVIWLIVVACIVEVVSQRPLLDSHYFSSHSTLSRLRTRGVNNVNSTDKS